MNDTTRLDLHPEGVFVGPPTSIEISKGDNGEVWVELYDTKGSCCGGVGVLSDGKIVATLIGGVASAIDTGRNEPLMIWRKQIEIARAAIKEQQP